MASRDASDSLRNWLQNRMQRLSGKSASNQCPYCHYRTLRREPTSNRRYCYHCHRTV